MEITLPSMSDKNGPAPILLSSYHLWGLLFLFGAFFIGSLGIGKSLVFIFGVNLVYSLVPIVAGAIPLAANWDTSKYGCQLVWPAV